MAVKKGLFFTVDAIIAVSILLGSLILITTFYISEQPRVSLNYIATDMVSVLAELEVNEVDNDYIDELIANGNITKLDNTLLEQIGELWAEGKEDVAEELARNLTEGYIENTYGYSIHFGDDVVYTRNKTLGDILSISSKLISGLDKNKTIDGIVSHSYLSSEQKRKEESYAYFGGFVGQGNITKRISGIPSDANVTSMTLEMDAGDDFTFFINGVQCSGTFSASTEEFVANRWDISSCKNYLNLGSDNDFKIQFSGDLTNAFVGGGYIKIRYFTETDPDTNSTGVGTYYFPGIDGITNVYSSFNVPGTLESWRMNVSLLNNYTTIIVVGNETVANVTGSDSVQNVYRERNGLSIPAGTLPIRIGVDNVTYGYSEGSGSMADTVLSTDVSGSMDECASYSEPYMCRYNCFVGGSKSCVVGDTSSCSGTVCGGFCWFAYGHAIDCTSSKLDIAKSASKNFVEAVFNYTGHRIGLDAYSSSVVSSLDLTTDEATLDSRIDSYSASGNTCICCGINKARKMVESSSNDRVIVVMSDGEANYYCDNFNDETGTSGGTAKQSAIDSGQYACGLGIDVYSVGFGEDADHTTLEQVACNSSMYFNATDVNDLSSVYEIIAGQIGLSANFSGQLINVTGEVEMAQLYPNSTIEFTYVPDVPVSRFGELAVALETPFFYNCSPQFYVYDAVTITDAKLTSYSSAHWTDKVTVNNVTVWDLSDYGTEYKDLGDPFVIQIPPSLVKSGEFNNITIRTGDDPYNDTGCSMNNSLLVLKGTVKASSSTTSVLSKSVGCNWDVEFDSGGISTITIPSGYNGSNQCYFTSSQLSYDDEDAIDVAAFALLSGFDFDNDSMSNINVKDMELTIDSLIVPQVPSMWGPVEMEVRVW